MIKIIAAEELPAKGRTKLGRARKDIEDFLKSGASVCECLYDTQEKNLSTRSIYQNYNQARKRLNAPVQVSRRKNRIFLIRTDDNAASANRRCHDA